MVIVDYTIILRRGTYARYFYGQDLNDDFPNLTDEEKRNLTIEYSVPELSGPHTDFDIR